MFNKEKQKKKKTSIFANIGISEEKDYFIENLGMLLASGMDILLALDGIKKEMRSKRMKAVIDDLKEDIDAGSTLSKALDKTGLLPKHVISLIRIGEEAGRLTENLKVIVASQQKERVFRSKIRSAMMYPVLVLFLTAVIGVGIAWFILPRLSGVFSQLRLELPFITKMLIAVGNFLGKYGLIVIPLFLLFIASAVYFVFIFSKTKHIGQSLLFFVPAIKRLIRELELARAGFILGTLLVAGLPIIEALESLSQATTFHAYQKLYVYIKNNVEDGSSFQKCFATYSKTRKLIPTPIQQMIVAGEQSGRLSETLIKIGEMFESKTETTTKNLTVILEPILLVIVWLGVVGVALAVILPIYSLIGGLNK